MKRIFILIAIAFFLLFPGTSHAQSSSSPGQSSEAQIILADKLSESEGIALCPDGKLFTIDGVKGDIVEVVDDTTLKTIAGGFDGAAGLACGHDGTLYAAGYDSGSVLMISADGKTKKVIASGFKTPNGIIAAADGTVYMSDSTSGMVYGISPDGTVEKLLSGINFANGLSLSPDGKLLYIAQTTPHKVIVTLLSGKNRGKKKTYASKLQMVDGITFDDDGNLYACLFSSGEIAKVDREGTITIIASGLYTPATPVVKNGTLYITSVLGKGLYKIPLEITTEN
ncbi:MAG TPA: SMP-30/gluconolactonase/LRE family protein [bacterium]|nr:SMP-30/gluconolactonase/LRE family protein [bacterium]